MNLNITACYRLAWRSFAKWWIPICLVSGLIVLFQIIPRIIHHAELRDLTHTMQGFVDAALEQDFESLETASNDAQEQLRSILRRVSLSTACLFPLIALLTVILLMQANRAVKNRRDSRQSSLFLVYVAVVHVIVAIGKAVAFLLFIVPGVYIYVKLLFVSLIMIEEKKGARAAIAMSWRMTSGNFWPLLALVVINTAIQMLMLPTVVGEVPATGFVNTARAAAFRMLLEGRRVAPVPPVPLGS